MYNHKKLAFRAGETIFREGEEGQDAYILLSGQVHAHRREYEWDVTVGRFGPDEIFGETSLLSGAPRVVTITAEKDCEVLVLESARFRKRVDELDPVMRLFIDVVSRRFTTLLSGSSDDLCDMTKIHPNQLKAISHLHFEADIERALAQNEFEIFYQPIICLNSGKITGCEALMRWRLADGSLVPPGQFIPVAEKSDLILKLTRFAIVQVCEDMREISLATLKNTLGAKPSFIAVNISGRDLEDENFCLFVENVVQANGLAEGVLKLEVTESSMMHDLDECCRRLNRLRKAGVDLAIDDFGTGYSNMGYLAKMPVSTLKIDRSFVSDMLNIPVQNKLTNGMLQFANGLDLKVVAEGIETEEQSAYLTALGCQMGQGYHYSKPLPLAEVVAFIEKWEPERVENGQPSADGGMHVASDANQSNDFPLKLASTL